MAELTAGEQAIADCYQALRRALEEHRGELSPFLERNGVKALACLWQCANGLGLDPEQLYELGG